MSTNQRYIDLLTIELWKRGDLSFLLFDYQVPLYNALKTAIKNPTVLKYVLNCARRFGKSTVLCLISIEYAIQNPKSQIRFAAPTGKAMTKIIKPIFAMLLETCPKDLKPNWHGIDMSYTFRNGSELHLAGTDAGHAENLRGTASNLNIVDEAGFCDDLNYVLDSILIPQTLTTGGTTLLASTPPKSPAHDFGMIAHECREKGNYQEFTIYDNKSLSKELIDLYAEEAGGYDTTTFKREYLCQFVVEQNIVIIREWDDKYIKDYPKNEYYEFYHKYVAMDLGVKDFTAIIFGYYDFRSAKLIIEDELTMNGPELTTNLLKDEVRRLELQLWPGKTPKDDGNGRPMITPEPNVYRRISDNNNLMLINDLSRLHNLSFMPTSKDELDAMVNEVREMVGQGRLVINPKCKQMIGCLKYGIWKDTKDKFHKMFGRSQVYGHYDHLAALIYLVRNLDKTTNPVPVDHNLNIQNMHINPVIYDTVNNNSDAFRKTFGIKIKNDWNKPI